MTGFSLKLKSKKGQHVVRNLNADATVGILKARISEITQIPQTLLHVLVGFPPRPLDLSKDGADLSSSGITNGDTLIVEEKPNTLKEDEDLARRLAAQEEEDKFIREIANQPDGEFMGILMKKVVPADNSCLFTSIGYVLNGTIDTDVGYYMRNIIAEHVSSDTETYNEAILGKPNLEYCTWIKRPDSWGGAIEVSILSNFYGIEIDVVDVTNGIINRFGEDKNYGQRVFLLFDGIHYDPLYMESVTDGPPKTIFPIEAENVYQQAEQLSRESKSSRQFTDVTKFTLRCLQCDVMLIGQNEALQHAKSTGHDNFGEV